MSTMVFSSTMKNAPKIVIASTGGTSSWPIESAAYWPTPSKSKTFSVRIAPPPIIVITLFGAFFIVLLNTIVDIIYAALDPRIRLT